jgi:hypothetical protein
VGPDGFPPRANPGQALVRHQVDLCGVRLAAVLLQGPPVMSAAAAGTLSAVGQDETLERAIAGALRGAIRDHGPITADMITSAVKRVVGNLKNARLEGMAAALGRKGGLANTRKTQAAKGRKGGRAGKGTKKPWSQEAKRRLLARRLVLTASRNNGMVLVMDALAPTRPELHKPMALIDAAIALGVKAEVLAIVDSGQPSSRRPTS